MSKGTMNKALIILFCSSLCRQSLTFTPSSIIKSSCARRANIQHHVEQHSAFNFDSTSTSKKHRSVLFSALEETQEEGLNVENGKYSRLLGILVLFTVPLSWGTYAPVVKYVYEMSPPIPGIVFSAAYYMIAAITLFLLKITFDTPVTSNDQGEKLTLAAVPAIEENQSNVENWNNEGTTDSPIPLQTLAGIELGSYLFLGNCLQVVGLETVPADRAAFLVQLTTIMVPLAQAGVAGDLTTISFQTWGACVLAFMGIIVMGLDRPDVDIQSLFNSLDGFGQGFSFSGGDSLIILAAVSYTMHVIRLGRYARFTSPLGLAASKATVEACLSLSLIAGLIYFGPSSIGFVNEMGSEIQSYFVQLKDQISTGSFPPQDSTKAAGAILWTGWVTCAYTIYAQSFGQRRVAPTDANLIYSMQPVFSAIFAWALLGESLGFFGYIGASLIGAALTIVTLSQPNDT